MTTTRVSTAPAPLSASDIAASLAFAAGLMVYALVYYTGQQSGDTGALYVAAWLAGSGQGDHIYWDTLAATPPEWEAAQAALGVTHVYPYFYPPLWAHLLGPLAVSMPFETFDTALLAVNALAHAATAFVAWRLFGRAGPLWPWMATGTLLMSFTVFGTSAFLYKNPHLVVSLLVLWGFERYWTGARTGAAVLFALAAAIKITPALFALTFVFRRDWKSFGICAAAGAAMLAASFALGGAASHAAWRDTLGEAQEMVSIARNNLAFQSVAHHIGQWIDGNRLYEMSRLPRPGWVVALQAVLLPGVLAALWWRFRGAPEVAWRRGFTPAMLLVVGLATPLAWTHYFTPVLCLLPGLFFLLGRTAALALSALVIGVNSLYFYADIAKPLLEPGIYPVIGFTSLALLAVVFAHAGRRTR